MYEDLTRFLPQLESEKACTDDEPIVKGEDGVVHIKGYTYLPWVWDFEDAVYKHELPKSYREILDEHGFKGIEAALESLDETDTDYILALIVGAIRSERFMDGNMKYLIEDRTMARLVRMLQAADEAA